jgi:hypothetical protein
MKRMGGIFEVVADARTLTLAAWRAAQGKRERPEVRAFVSRLDENTAELSRALRAGEFRFGQYRTFSIRDPKTRLIHAPPFRDRVVHHAIIAACGPVFERGAIAHSYACRAGRGQHAALRQTREWMRRGDWFLKLDVAKYYDSIPHGILRERLARRFRERRLLALFDWLLESHHHTPGRGLPIGALTSQYLGNFHLDIFDHWVNQRQKLPRYLRYMDDLLFLADDSALHRLLPEAVALLDGLGLRVKDGGVLNRCEVGVPYLGFVLYPDRTRLNRAGRRRLRVKVKALEKSFAHGGIREWELQSRAASLFAHAGFGEDVAWRRMVVQFSRIWDAQEPATRPARRVVEQHGEELPLREPQQERARQPEQEHRLSGLSGSRHDDLVSTDDAHSRAPLAQACGDETTGKTPLPADIRPPLGAMEKAGGGAPGEVAP